MLSQILQRRKEGISGHREKLEQALAALSKPFIVVLDDIDRLSSAEIREIFKLVRLTASFPNVIYVVAFDRARVEKALSEEGIAGRDYLDKILQLGVDLPEVPPQVMDLQISRALDNALSGIDNPGHFDEEEWPNIFSEIIRPLIRNMRDVRRYAAAVRGTVKALDGQIALADLLALEAVRTFLPDVHGCLHSMVNALTTPSESHSDSPHLKTAIDSLDSLLQLAGPEQTLVRSMIMLLFPAAQRHIGGSHYRAEWKKSWLQERRVSHGDILRLYLEHVAGEGLRAFVDAEWAFKRMSNHTAFDEYLRSLDVNRLEDVIKSLEVFEDKFAPEQVVPATTVLLNLLPILPERPRGMFDIDICHVVGRVTFRLLRSLKDPNEVEKAAKMILPQVTSLSAKLELITDVGYREGAGHKLISQTAANELETTWRSEVRAASPQDLACEYDLMRVLYVTKLYAIADEPALTIPDTPEVTLSILRSARSEARTQSMGSRHIRRSSRLAWDVLIDLFGGQDNLVCRITRAKGGNPEGAKDLFELADKYIGGSRPGNFDDD
ncbi:MAG TPA: P-loop NTPase fold protein [Nitrospira sp.]|nr:P-loop NTPase fold protein [Nitrospira sp.]